MLGEVTAALSIWDRIKKWRDSRNNPPVESVAQRFIRLFESHDVHRNQIPRYFGHGITLKDVQDEGSILAILNETRLDAACMHFGVRREWLDGADDRAYPFHDFYKQPEEIAGFLNGLLAANPDGGLRGVLFAPDVEDGQAVLVLYERVGTVGDKTIYRYHLCNDWLFEYWKSRAYLTALIAAAWKRDIYIRGVYLSAKDTVRLDSGTVLLGSEVGGIWSLVGKRWDPEDMALQPDVFLRGLDPERDSFGYISGLELWLRLEKDGYMDMGLSLDSAGDVRSQFQSELDKWKAKVRAEIT